MTGGHQHEETIRAALLAAYHIGECADHPEHLMDAENKARDALAALDALVARNRDLEQALAVYATPTHWAIGRDDLDGYAIMWIGPGAYKGHRQVPDAMETARAVLGGGEEPPA